MEQSVLQTPGSPPKPIRSLIPKKSTYLLAMKFSHSALFLFILSLFSCSQKSQTSESELIEPPKSTIESPLSNQESPEPTLQKPTQESLPTDDNTMTSVDWNGTYTGTIPCGHCEGITVWLTLNLNNTFEFKTSYLGLNDARDEIFTGKFSWDQTGSKVTLEGLIGGYPGKFFVGENRIWYLDAEGNRHTGKQAEDYILKKM